MFDSVASQYDLMNDLMSAGLHRVWKDDFVRLSGISAAVRQQQGGDAAGMKLLDVAGGTGGLDTHFQQEYGSSRPQVQAESMGTM